MKRKELDKTTTGKAGSSDWEIEISEGSGTLFDVPESNLDDGTHFADAYDAARDSALDRAGDPTAKLSELRNRKWKKAQEARDLSRAAAYERAVAHPPSQISNTSIVILAVIGWILLSFALVAAGYEPEPESYQPPRVNTDPTHPCYGLDAFECKWN
jgi:hypothetical protein